MKLNSDYWENRYQTNDFGWDCGEITQPIKAYIDQIENKNIKILIPGCGNGYEFEYLIHNHFKNSFVLDYAKTPLENLKSRIENYSKEHFIQSDFFEHRGHYDLILEQTFFCALDPDLRKDYVKKMHELLHKNGKLVGLLFQFPISAKGPPFGGSKEEYIKLFTSYFTIQKIETAYNSIKPREGNELFFIFTKK
jgi:methyl halide transferase